MSMYSVIFRTRYEIHV